MVNQQQIDNNQRLLDTRSWFTNVYRFSHFNEFVRYKFEEEILKRIIQNGQTGSSWHFLRFQSLRVIVVPLKYALHFLESEPCCSKTTTDNVSLKSYKTIQDDEKDPDKLAKASADFIHDVAFEESLRFIREDPELNSMTERQKKFVLRLMTDRVVDRFIADFEKKVNKSTGSPNIKTEICFVTCDECKSKK